VYTSTTLLPRVRNIKDECYRSSCVRASYNNNNNKRIVSAVALLSGQSTGGRKRPPTTTTVAPRHRPTAVIEDEDLADQLQQESECPEPNGFFADASQCDKYYACSDNKITEKLCPDGMVFNDYSSQQEKCDLPLNIDCSQRPALREYIYTYIR